MRRILSILLENEPGALSRIVGLFSQRGYNIESLSVAPTQDRTLSRITISTSGDDRVLEQITKHVNKLVDVIKLSDLTDGSHIERELMLIKLRAQTPEIRDEIKRCSDIFRGQIIDVSQGIFTVQLTGTGEKLDAFIEALIDQTEIVETVRSGVSGIARGERALRV